MGMNNLNMHSDLNYGYLQIAVLKHDIELPKKLGFKRRRDYWNRYGNMIGYFYIPMLMPLIEEGEPTEVENEAPDTSNSLSDSGEPAGYITRNYVSLVIPKYICMNFVGKIPMGTKFIVGFINGETRISDIAILGVYALDFADKEGQILTDEDIQEEYEKDFELPEDEILWEEWDFENEAWEYYCERHGIESGGGEE